MSRVIHFEIGVDNPEKAIKFYTEVFGWKIEKWNGPDEYWLVTTGSKEEPGIDGGIFRRPGPINVSLVNNIDVPSVDEYVKKITQSGGKILMPKTAIPSIGWYAYCEDPEGNAFGIMQSDMSVK